MSTAQLSLERLALRAIRAFCLTTEASLHYFARIGTNETAKFHPRLPILCADFAEHIAQDALEDGRSERSVLESLLRDLDWLKQFDREELHRVSLSAVPTDEDLASIRRDVESALSTTLRAQPNLHWNIGKFVGATSAEKRG
jgi:hypothetical protein